MKSNCQLLIIGAGAAGIGAAHAAKKAGIDHLVVEASHRVGGRGLTEELAPGIPWDLGCHWLHSGSINGLAPIATQLGLHYDTHLPSRGFYMNSTKLPESEVQEYDQFGIDVWNKIEESDANGEDLALGELIDQNSKWAPTVLCWHFTQRNFP